MIFLITMKDPDGFAYSIKDAVDSDDCVDTVDSLREACGKWFGYDEYVTIEVDTDKGTARVVPLSE